MDIIFYLTKNYSSNNCEKLEEFFQNESGYYLIMEIIKDGSQKPPVEIVDASILKDYFNQINQELELRHKFGLYDPFIDTENCGFLSLEGKKTKIFLTFHNFWDRINFRYNSTNKTIMECIKKYEIFDPELIEKFVESEEILAKEEKKKYMKEIENIIYNVNSKNELYNLGIMMLKYLKNTHNDDKDNNNDNQDIYSDNKEKINIDEEINKIKDENLKNLITSLLKEKASERISWEEYINHPFFKNDSNINSIDSYKYEEISNFQIRDEEITNIIILKNNFILLKEKKKSLYLIIEKTKKCEYLTKIKGDYLYNLNDLILIDDKEKKQIYIYKLKDNINLDELYFKNIFDNIQTIDIKYNIILPLYKDENKLLITTGENTITLWKNENSKYVNTLSITIDTKIIMIKEIKPKRLAFVCRENKKKLEKNDDEDDYSYNKEKDTLAFYDFDKMDTLVKKGSIQNLENIEQICIINDKFLVYKDISNMLKIIDIDTYQIVDKIMMETRHLTIFNNKFGRLLVGLLYDKEYWYIDVFKEYSYEKDKLIRKKTLKNVNPWCIAEGGDNLISFGTHNGYVYIFK